MHLNYFALRHFSGALKERLKECTFINAFSFSKEELILSFLSPDNRELFLSINLVNKSCYLQILDNYNRPKRNFLYQFEECNGGLVRDVIQVNYDRSFYILFKTGFKLLFKLHGGFSNIILIGQEDDVEEQFRKEFLNDATLKIESMAKDYDLNVLLSQEIEDYRAVKKLIPLLDDYCLEFLKSVNFLNMPGPERAKVIEQYFTSNSANFYLTEAASKSHLQIFPKSDAIKFVDPLEAYTRLSRLVLPSCQLEHLKENIKQQLEAEIKKREKQLYSTQKHIENAATFIEYENLGHIIMANMHAIPKQCTKIELFDFYKNKEVSVRLDKNLNPQENAEKYYRKSKALKQELPKLKKTLEDIEKEYEKAKGLSAKLNSINDTKLLKAFTAENNLLKLNEDAPIFPFRKMIVDDFEVWIGKNAANNDLLTFGYAHKNDLWLHARDVSGSHVIIRNQSGKIITRATIEKVAAIAAYYSKSKNQNLATVVYTIKKFVVKRKGRNPGEVNLMSEQTVMVKPMLVIE